ncbi:ATP-dependent nuclease [Streptococcus ruminicola]|uniref:ATP-dependent nuclease n=1 Tax=Streptococcus ruminicola TaxID=2686210 RepID=UPI0012FBA44D|nr:AAA family ATPase [Streptococcus ruminicola]
MINKLYIKNFRSIKNIKISNIKNQLGLIGENSSGKSSILQALLIALGEKKIQKSDIRFNQHGENESEVFIGLGLELDYYSIQRLINYKSDEYSKICSFLEEVKKSCKGSRKRDTTSKAYTTDFKKIFLEKIFNEKKSSQSLFFGITFSKNLEKKIEFYNFKLSQKKENNLKENEVAEIFNVMLPPYAYLRDERGFEKESNGESDSTTNELFSLLLPSMSRSGSQLGEDEVKNTVISELTIPQINKYLLKKVEEEAKDITESLNKNFKKYYNEKIEVQWNFSNELFKNLNIETSFCMGGFKNHIDFQSVGSGTRSLYKMVLLQTLLERQSEGDEPVLFLLEEPELYLYPKLEQKMEGFITSLTEKNQVIITTHSPISIKSFTKDSLYKVERRKETTNAVPVTKLSKIEDKSQVTALLGYDVTYLLGKDYIIFVEGKDDVKAYEHLIEKVFCNFSNKIIPMTSVTKLSAAVSFDFLDGIRSRAKSVYIIDSDGTESEERKKKVVDELAKQAKNVDREELLSKIILTEYCMLECYTFEYKYLKQKIGEEEYLNRVIDFLKEKEKDINNQLRNRDQKPLDDFADPKDKFEHVRKYGFTKQLIKDFRKRIGGQGFKRISDLTVEELNDCCEDLIDNLKKCFGI